MCRWKTEDSKRLGVRPSWAGSLGPATPTTAKKSGGLLVVMDPFHSSHPSFLETFSFCLFVFSQLVECAEGRWGSLCRIPLGGGSKAPCRAKAARFQMTACMCRVDRLWRTKDSKRSGVWPSWAGSLDQATSTPVELSTGWLVVMDPVYYLSLCLLNLFSIHYDENILYFIYMEDHCGSLCHIFAVADPRRLTEQGQSTIK